MVRGTLTAMVTVRIAETVGMVRMAGDGNSGGDGRDRDNGRGMIKTENGKRE